MIDEAVERRGLDIEKKKVREIKIKKKRKRLVYLGKGRGATTNLVLPPLIHR